MLPSRYNRVLGLGDLLARNWANTLLSSSTRSTRISILPPDDLRPNKRAGITRVSLNTNKSLGSNKSGKLLKLQSCN